jgi:hypothetical protein
METICLTDNPVRDAETRYAAQQAYSDLLDAEVEGLQWSLLAALMVGDMGNKAHFLPQPEVGAKPTVGKLWAQAFEYSLTDERMASLALLLADVAAGRPAADRAKEVLRQAAGDWARAHAEVTL